MPDIAGAVRDFGQRETGCFRGPISSPSSKGILEFANFGLVDLKRHYFGAAATWGLSGCGRFGGSREIGSEEDGGDQCERSQPARGQRKK